MQVIHDAKARLQPDCLPVFTSDGLNLYFYAITANFGQWVNVVGKRLTVWHVASTLLYGQLRKVHTHGKVKFSSTCCSAHATPSAWRYTGWASLAPFRSPSSNA